MLKHSFFVFLFSLGICLPAKAQDFLSYYTEKNKADIFIMENQYQAALDIYAQILPKYQYPFLVDIYDAILCAAFVNDTTHLFQWIEICGKRAYPIHFLFGNKIVKKYQKTTTAKYLLKTYGDGQYFAEIDTALRNQIYKMRERDQVVRLKYQNNVAAFNIPDSLNIRELCKIIDEKGFPSEKQFGVSILGNPIELILRHTIMRTDIYPKNIELLLLTALKEEKIYNQSFAWAMERFYPAPSFGSEIGFSRNKIISEPPYLAANIDYINNRRAAIGLCSIEVLRRKITYQNKKAFFRLGVK